MPYRRRGSYRRPRNYAVTVSNKNSVSLLLAGTAGATLITDIVDTQDSATLAVADDVQRGCIVKAVYCELWVRASEDIAVGVTTAFEAYIIKNGGNNLTPPVPGTQGTSNEKKYIFKSWKGLIGAQTASWHQPYSWKGWIKIPKIYQRFGANDKLQLVSLSTGSNMVQCTLFIYKWRI